MMPPMMRGKKPMMPPPPEEMDEESIGDLPDLEPEGPMTGAKKKLSPQLGKSDPESTKADFGFVPEESHCGNCGHFDGEATCTLGNFDTTPDAGCQRFELSMAGEGEPDGDEA